MKKGFTIVELLMVILIIAVIGGIGLVSYNYIFDSASTNYYKTVENSLKLSGSEYFQKNRDELPISGYSLVTQDNLIEGNYISPIKDKNGEVCEKGDVIVLPDHNTNNYKYIVCLKCGEYASEEEICSSGVNGEIIVTAKAETSNKSYNPLQSYKNASIIKNDNLAVNLYLNNSNLSYFKIDKVLERCNTVNQRCDVIINKSGSYRISAYNNNNEKIASDRIINVKIDREKPTFEIINDKRYLIMDENYLKNIEIKLANIKDDFGVGKIEYCITENGDCEPKDLLNDNNYIIKKSLNSGSYIIKAKVSDLVDNFQEEVSNFDVSYYVTLKYVDKEENFEVIKGKTYGYLDSLPTSYNQKVIKWTYNGRTVNNETTVIEGKKHILIAENNDKVDIPTSAYCTNNLIYNGRAQKLTKDAPFGVKFDNNIKVDAGEYLVTAKLLYGYVWSDNSNGIKEFNCRIEPREITVKATDQSKIYDGKALNADSTCSITSGSLISDHTITCISTGTITNVGSINKVLSQVLIKNNKNQNVTSGYKIKTENASLTINKATTSIICKEPTTYTGSEIKTYSSSSGCSSYINDKLTDAGTYRVTCKGDANHEDSSCVFTINKASSSITCNSATNYTGNSIKSYSESSGCTSYINGEVTNAGTYTVTCNGDANHEESSCSFTVNKVAASLKCSDKDYTGSNVTGCSCTGGTCNNCTKKDIGTYTASCTPDDNHTTPDDKQWKIKQSCSWQFDGYGSWFSASQNWDCYRDEETYWNTGHCTEHYGSSSRAHGYSTDPVGYRGKKLRCYCYSYRCN